MNELISFVLVVTLMICLIILRDAFRTVWSRHGIPSWGNVQGWAEWSVLLMPLSVVLTTIYFLLHAMLERPILVFGAWTLALVLFRGLSFVLMWILTGLARNHTVKEHSS